MRGFKRSLLKCLAWYGILLWVLGSVGCNLLPGLASPKSPTETPLFATEAPPVGATFGVSPAEPSPTLRPWPTLPSAPALIGTLDLAVPQLQGRGPTALGLLGMTLYVANEGSRNLLLFQGSQPYQALPLDAGPYRIVSDPVNGRLYVLCLQGGTVLMVADGQIAGRWSLGGTPSSGVLVGGYLWVGTWQGDLWRVDASEQIGQAPIASGLGMVLDLLALDERWLLVITHQEAILYDTSSLQVGLRHPLVGYQTAHLAQGMLYVVRYDVAAGATWLETWDAARLEPVSQVPAPDAASALWVDPATEQAIVAAAERDRLYRIDLKTGALLQEHSAGLEPQQMLSDGAGGLYVSYKGNHLVVKVRVNDLAIMERIPTAGEVTALAPGWEIGDLLVGLNTGEIRILKPDASFQAWQVGAYPVALASIPLLDRVAVLDGALGALLLVDYQGNIVEQYPTGPRPRGLYVDTLHQALYAGDIRVDWSSGAVETLDIPVGSGEAYPPVGIVRDTKRDRLYAIVWNGVLGSNGGYRVVRKEGAEWRADLPAPGQVSVIDVVYDERSDRFYSTYAHMGQYGLQVTDAETLTIERTIPLERYPQAMALSELGHLWLVLAPPLDSPSPTTRLLALNMPTGGLVATLEIPERVDHAALEPVNHRLYLACGATGHIYIGQDVPVPAPGPTVTPFATVLPSPMPLPTSTPSLTPTSVPPMPTPTATPQPSPTPCAEAVAPDLYEAWQSAGPDVLGCPQGPARVGFWGWQDFERGEMFWIGETRQILILFDDGTWTYIPDQWQEGMPELSCEASPPPGLWQPIRGFGLAWCREPGLRERLGWALDSEIGFESLSQPFAEGSLIRHPQGGAIWVSRQGTWARIVP